MGMGSEIVYFFEKIISKVPISNGDKFELCAENVSVIIRERIQVGWTEKGDLFFGVGDLIGHRRIRRNLGELVGWKQPRFMI